MKHSLLYVLCAEFLISCTHSASKAPISIVWEMGQNEIEPGCFENTFHITNNSKQLLDSNWTLYYAQISVFPMAQDTAPLKIECISGSYHKMYPTKKYQPVAPGETLHFTCRHRGRLTRESGAPQGAYIVIKNKDGKDQKPQTVTIKIKPFEHEYQWSRPMGGFPYADGNYAYRENAMFGEPVSLRQTDLLPTPKSIVQTGGVSPFTSELTLGYDSTFANEANLLKNNLKRLFGCTFADKAATIVELRQTKRDRMSEEQYELTIENGHILLTAATPHGIFNACQTLTNLLGNVGKLPASISNIHITDQPDIAHRGFMLDVARNFTSKENVMQLIDILASYKINILHLHLTDDEGWRIEIPGLEELTQTGAHRGYTTDETDCLYPTYGGGWDPKDSRSANGYYSKTDFIEILKYAKQRHIQVIPEVDMPGHSRAAIKAMTARYKKYIATNPAKAEEFMLIDFNDTSIYVSAQHYTDNVINVAMPSAYRFIEKVIDEIVAIYKEANAELSVFHIGGDEVPHGAWEGSAICRQIMQQKGMQEIRDLKDYFLEQVIPMISKYNIQIAGWEEVAIKKDKTVNEHFRNCNILSYCWNTVPEWKGEEIPYTLANAGYPIILCNVANLYLDMAYCNHQQENGVDWGGYVNEYNTFDMLPYDIYKSVRTTRKGIPVDITTSSKGKTALKTEAETQITGIQGQLWAETIRDFNQIEYYLFPKIFGLIERGWNMRPEWASPYNEDAYKTAKRKYNAQICQFELPRLAKRHINFRISQPGLCIQDCLLYANSAIPQSIIRYTTDGTEPDEHSAIWETPLPCNASIIKAKNFYLNKYSITTTLINRQ